MDGFGAQVLHFELLNFGGFRLQVLHSELLNFGGFRLQALHFELLNFCVFHLHNGGLVRGHTAHGGDECEEASSCCAVHS